MGVKLIAIYDDADKLGGLKAKLKMAMLTKLSVSAAESAPDSPENIKKFEDALATVKSALG